MRTVMLLFILITTVSGCTRMTAGVPEAAPPHSSEPAVRPESSPASVERAGDSRPELPEPADGSGFSSEPLDQPPSIPDMFWQGWADSCAWIDAALATKFGATGPGTPHHLGCSLPLTAGTQVQVAWLGPFSALVGERQFVRPLMIAGQQARQYAYPAMPPNSCALHVHSRSTTTLHIAVWNETEPNKPEREARCTTAATIAEAAVTRFVPAAGGTPRPGTPHQPSPAALNSATACTVATKDVASLSNLQRADGTPGTTDLGSTCHHSSPYAQAEVLLAPQHLTGVPFYSLAARTVERKLVGLPARMEHTDDDCAVVVALADQATLRITYRINRRGNGALACRYAEVMTAAAVSTLLHRS